MPKTRWELKLSRSARNLEYRKRSNHKWGTWQKWEIRETSRFPLALFGWIQKFIKHETVRRADKSFETWREACVSGLTDVSGTLGCGCEDQGHGLVFDLRGKRLCEFLVIDRTSENTKGASKTYSLLMSGKDEEALRFQRLEKESKAMLRMALVIYEGRDEPVYVGAKTR